MKWLISAIKEMKVKKFRTKQNWKLPNLRHLKGLRNLGQHQSDEEMLLPEIGG